MEATEYAVEPLAAHHDRTVFDSGSVPLDHYFRHQAGQDARNRVARCFVLRHLASEHVAGYYTLNAYGISPSDLPPAIAHRLLRYPLIPAILLGRLAIDRRFQGQKLGRRLLLSALARAMASSTEVAAFAVIVDALDEAARRFYERYDFQPFPDTPTRLFLPMRSIEQSGLGHTDADRPAG